MKLTFTVKTMRNGCASYRVTVPAVETGMTGHWHGERVYMPDMQHLMQCMPPAYRKAIGRGVFWTVRDAPSMPQRADLRALNGSPMGTMYAYPDWIPDAQEAGLPQTMHGVWVPFCMLDIGDVFTLSGAVQYRKVSDKHADLVPAVRERVPFTCKWQSVQKVSQ